MDTSRTHLIVIRPGQKALANTLIDDKDNLGAHLSTQECGLFHPCCSRLFPFREIFGCFDDFDVCWRLIMTAMMVDDLLILAGDMEVWWWLIRELLGL